MFALMIGKTPLTTPTRLLWINFPPHIDHNCHLSLFAGKENIKRRKVYRAHERAPLTNWTTPVV